MSNYKKCDCCGKLKPEEQLEDAVINLKKCGDCDVSITPVTSVSTTAVTGEVMPPRAPMKKMPQMPPPHIASAFNKPPGDQAI